MDARRKLWVEYRKKVALDASVVIAKQFIRAMNELSISVTQATEAMEELRHVWDAKQQAI